MDDAIPTGVVQLLPRDPQDGFLLENDIVGVRVWGTAQQPTLSVGRSDIWDRRWFGNREPIVTLATLRELAASDRLDELGRDSNNGLVYAAYGKYDFPCPKPGAQVILLLPFATQTTVCSLPDGRVELVACGEGKRLSARLWVSLEHPLIVISCQGEGLNADDFAARIYRHHDTIFPGQPVDLTLGGTLSATDFERLPMPRAFQSAGAFGIVQDFLPEMTFPDGFAVAAAAVLVGGGPSVSAAETGYGLGTPLWAEREGRVEFGVIKRYTPINQAPGAAATARFLSEPPSQPLASGFSLLAAITTTQDHADPIHAAVQLLGEASRLDAAGLWAEQRAAMVRHARPHPARLEARSGLGINGLYGMTNPAPRQEGERAELAAPPMVWPRLRRRGGYYSDIPPCTVANTRFWFQDASLWHNDFHLNEIRAEMMLTMGLFPELLPYCEMVAMLLPMAEENAHDVYGLPGAMFPLTHFPLRCRRGIAHANVTWEQDMGLNGLVCKPVWLYYRYTGDREFLQDLAYPILRSAAQFSAAYLSEEADGLLHIQPTVSPEHWGLTPHFSYNRDCTSALTLTKYLLTVAAEAAHLLGVDLDVAKVWRAAAARLTPYPTFDSPEGPVWVDVAGAAPIEYNVAVPLTPVFWGDDVGLDSPAEVLALARRTAQQIRIWQVHSFYLDHYILPRLGVWRDGAKLGPENCLLSYQSLHIFPCVPPTGEIVMENLAAQGGFRVSAVRTASGAIEDVAILSTVGGNCCLANPWPGREVVVRDTHRRRIATQTRADGTIEFATTPGDHYAVVPVM